MIRKLIPILIFVSGLIFGLLVAIITDHYHKKQKSKAAYYMAANYYEEGRYDLSAALLNQSIAIYSKDYGPFYLLGDIYKRKGNAKLALQMYKMALKGMENENKKMLLDRQNLKKRIRELETIRQD